MPWYVFALVDEVPNKNAGRGLSAPLSFRRVANAFVAVERRADVPPVDFGALRKHHRIVCRLAAAVPAILPVRFGTLMDAGDLEEALQERDEDIAQALSGVRDRVQFTWRMAARGPAAAARKAGKTIRARASMSGTEYLHRRAAPAIPPASLRRIRSELEPLIVAEKYQPAGELMPETLYHLVDRRLVDDYRRSAVALRTGRPNLIVTGPWPPFAFAPEIL